MNKNILPATALLNGLTFCVFDLETTGGNHTDDYIIEIGLVRIENLKITEQKDFLIKPDKTIPDFIQKLTSIRPNDLKNSPKIEDVVEEIIEFMGDSILVAHNTAFDVPFFNSVLKRLNRPELTNKSICTNIMTKYLIPNLLNSNLGYMSKILGIEHKKAHRALDDAYATAKLLLNYLNIFIDKNITKVNHLYYPRNRYELDRLNFKENKNTIKEIQLKLETIKTPFLFTVKGANGVILFAIPCTNSDEEKKFVIKSLEKLKWETCTLRIFGSLLESIVHFNLYFNKLDNIYKNEIIKFLWKTHLPKHKRTHVEKNDTSEIIEINNNVGDFIISNHLVPEQYIIYPTVSLHKDSGLIFRYPGHQKKLLQYINAKSTRMVNNKLKKARFNALLKNFIDKMLVEKKEELNSDLFIFDKRHAIKKSEVFIEKINQFSSDNPNPYKYPKEYI